MFVSPSKFYECRHLVCVCVCPWCVVAKTTSTAYLSLTLDEAGVKMAVELVECLCQFLLCLLVGFHDHSLEVDWETVPTHTHQ